jgi:hypothetical protein
VFPSTVRIVSTTEALPENISHWYHHENIPDDTVLRPYTASPLFGEATKQQPPEYGCALPLSAVRREAYPRYELQKSKSLANLKMEATYSFETSVLTRATRYKVPGDIFTDTTVTISQKTVFLDPTLLPLRPLFGFLYQPRMKDKYGAVCGMRIGRGNNIIITVPQWNLVHHKPHMTRPRIEITPSRLEAHK